MMMMKLQILLQHRFLFTLTLLFYSFFLGFSKLEAQAYWQQEVKYHMEIDMDAEKHQFTGKQKIVYTNNSPESLDKVFYHLYFNAFQPGSMMDVRSRTILDPDARVGDRILNLSEDEIGYQKIKSLKQDGKKVDFEVVGTILEVRLKKAILPGTSSTFEMEFEAQVPLQIRRSGRDNKEGIEFSMTQWYPKMTEFDFQGWHANPYVGREFHGVWGDFDVIIMIDKSYVLGGSGILVDKSISSDGKQKWHFRAENVHDFAWGADPDYHHVSKISRNGTVFNYYYQIGPATKDNWEKLPEVMHEAIDFINEMCGVYPYPQYSIIQGGDGGMEYPMATLITGERNFSSLVSVCIHEILHSWYQLALGTNESLYHWMDEGFTNYFQAKTMNHLREKGLIPGKVLDNPHKEASSTYISFAKSGLEEAMITHADHFRINAAYGKAAYTKGSVFLDQLEYVVGDEAFKKGILDYFETWKFKHPTPNDFIRVMEKASGLELDWYKEYFVNSTKTIDYGIGSVDQIGKNKISVILERLGPMPMPIDLVVTKSNGKQETYYIPLRIMRGEKQFPKGKKNKLAEDWPWTHPSFYLEINCPLEDISKIEIDPSHRLQDIDKSDNKWEKM